MRLGLLIVLFFFSVSSFAQTKTEDYRHLTQTVRNYLVYKTISDIKIDGEPNEISWQKAAWSEYFQDIEGELKPQPLYQTRFKMLWDENNLYILAELEEPHIWSYYTRHDQIIYHENDFEIFIDPTRDTHNYFEFELNAQNTLLDLFMPKPYRNGGQVDIGWNCEDFESAVSIEGSVNNPEDTDVRWLLEVAIPFKSLNLGGKYKMPENGSYFKINFSRVQWQTEVVDGRYQKIKNKVTNKDRKEDNWVWSAQGVINMHYPERWGLAQFSSNPVGGEAVAFMYPDEEKFGSYLWLVYYKQQSYRRINGEYATTLSELDLFQSTKTKSGEAFLYKMEVDGHTFSIFLQTENGLHLSLNQDGLFKVITN